MKLAVIATLAVATNAADRALADLTAAEKLELEGNIMKEWKKVNKVGGAGYNACTSESCKAGAKLGLTVCGTNTLVDLKGNRIDPTWSHERCMGKGSCTTKEVKAGATLKLIKTKVYCSAVQATVSAAAALVAVAYSM